MIKVMTTKQDNEYIAIEVSGHAESGPYGFDLVCAGVSAITFGAVNALFEVGEYTPIVEQGDDGGYLYVELPDDLSADQM
ncbi:MAG TPA: ribosomal-processing cysteine protease Prp, partial [Pseudogracilibacillus sp.]|nr:ribosomal-processing cysteine protease Prp [Pseudogracilibacillus sp.]